uniref:TonB-dependent receptor n=1 Tax=uncultured Draconibacterium sp. TaxID=1573823 RepID=UPI003217677B
MRITLFLLLASILQSFATDIYSQETRISLNLSHTKLVSVLDEIEERTEFFFLYNEKLVDTNREVSVSVENQKINEILDKLFEGIDVVYTIIDRKIILAPEFISGNVQQQKTVSGKVTDTSNSSLPGVTVIVKGTTQGTITDVDGNYSLANVAENAVLVFSFVGMKSQEVPVAHKSSINVVMEDETIGMEEVVVVGYGTQKKVNLTGSVDVVTGEKLANRPASNVSLLLQGASPNLNISLSKMGGEPGASQSWQIRGVGSISSNSAPLVLVDGVEMDHNLLDPESIESVSVLKDASASAVYGSRAAFGVVLITTKKGKKNQPLQIQYSNNLSFAVPIYVPNMENSYTYAIAFNQARANAGLSPKFPDEQVQRIKGYIDGTYEYPYDPENPPTYMWAGRHVGNANVNWTQEFYKKYSFQQKHNVTLSGSSEGTQYYFTAGYYDQPGLYSWGDDGYKRYNILANFSSKINEWSKFDFSTKYARSNTDNPIGMVGLPRTYTWSQIIDFWPTMPMYNIDGSVNNPIVRVLQDGGRILNERNDLWVNLGTELEPVKGWKTNIRYNYNYRSNSESRNPKPVPVSVPNGTWGNIGESTTSAVSILDHSKYSLFSAHTSYEKNIGRHYVKGLIGYERDKRYNKWMYGSKMDLITPEVVAIRAALGTTTLDDKISHWATEGVFGRLNYNFDGKYLFEFSARYDGSSRFESGSRWGFFPSASVGYNIAKENFWKPFQAYVNTFKLRTSYGSLGNQNVANYLYLATIPVTLRQDYLINDQLPLYAGNPNIISDDLTWETITTLDVGFDAEFFNNRLSLVFDWYERITSDMIGPSMQLPTVLGTSAPSSNNAKLSTKGVELSLGWKDRISKDFSYEVKVGFSDNKTVIKEYLNENGNIYSWYAGRVYGDQWGYTTDGIIQSVGEEMPDQSYIYSSWTPGDIKYKDLNDDGKINPGTYTLDNHGDLSIIANTTPRYNYNISVGFTWKDFDFNMFWQGIGKRDLLPGIDSEYFWGLNSHPNTSALFKEGDMLDYWRPADETNILGPNTDAYYPKPYFSSQRNKNSLYQTRYVLNAAYLRLKNLQVGYNIPQNLLDKIFIQKARVYVSGENLLTFSPLSKLFEPETTVSSNPNHGGVDMGEIYPITRMFSFGVSLTF